MPYIANDKRKEIDTAVDQMAKVLNNAIVDDNDFPGVLNYAITKIILKTIKIRFGSLRYHIWCWVSGMLMDIRSEFYRRRISSYEDTKKIQNGDVGYEDLK